ncbi:MAG: calcium-binding protein [Bauldia sp.]|nr:calcium-binding protein [Bauldia sp.]
MNASGDYLITYERSAGAGNTDIVARIFNGDTQAVGDEFLINSLTTESTNPEVAALSNGDFVVVMEDEYGGLGDIDVGVTMVSGSGVGVANFVAFGSAAEDDPHVAALAGGGFVVVWRDEEGDGSGNPGIKAALYDNSGHKDDGGTFSVNTTTTGNQSDPEVAALADGGFVIVWTDSGSGVIRGQRFDATGNKVGGEFTQNYSVEDNPVVAALSDGRFIVGFEDVDNAPIDVDIHGTIFDPRTGPINGTSEGEVLTSRKDGATVNGLGGADTLLGQAANDTLNGGTGADEMRGRAGNDTYVVDNAGDKVIENAGEGTDTVKSSVSFILGANVENLTLLEAAAVGASLNINATGNGLANTLTGNSGSNILDGKAGADTMIGKAGNDTYVVDNAGDKVIENAGEGTDTVKSSIAYTLGANLEKLVLTGSAAINGTGNGLANALVGNAGGNTLDGGVGDDILSGGLGKDVLLGKGGKDVFVFADPVGAANADEIVKFKHKKDSIFLDKDIFAAVGTKVSKKEYFEGSQAQDKNDHIIRKGNKLFYDEDGKGGAKQVLFAKLDKKAVTDHKDFDVGDFVV